MNPMMYIEERDPLYFFASKAGLHQPDRYCNLKANPNVQFEVGDQILASNAEEIRGAERARINA